MHIITISRYKYEEPEEPKEPREPMEPREPYTLKAPFILK